MEDLKSVLVDLQFKLHALVDRIANPKHPTADADRTRCIKPDLLNGGPGCGEQYHTPVLTAFHKWAKILLSLFVHKVRKRTAFQYLLLPALLTEKIGLLCSISTIPEECKKQNLASCKAMVRDSYLC